MYDPNAPPVTPPEPSKARLSAEIAEQTAEYLKTHKAIRTRLDTIHNPESLRATYPTLSKGRSPGPHKKDKK